LLVLVAIIRGQLHQICCVWFKDTGIGSVTLKQIFEQDANDANGNAVRDGVRALLDT